MAGRSGGGREGGIAGPPDPCDPPRSPPCSPLCLHSYTDVAKSTGDDLKELTTLRAMACGKRNALTTATMDDEGEPAEGERASESESETETARHSLALSWSSFLAIDLKI